jgi:hypothetical protein
LRSTIAGALAQNLLEPEERPAESRRQPEDRERGGEPATDGRPAPAPVPAVERPGDKSADKPNEKPDKKPTERPAEKPGAPAPGAAEPPVHWSAADKEKLNALPEASRATVLDLCKRMEGSFTPKLQRGAQLERDYGELDRTIFTPQQRELIQAQGQTTANVITSWANVERALDRTSNPNNPALRHEILARMIHNYGADPAEIAQILGRLRGAGGNGGGSPGGGPGNGAYHGSGNGAGNGAAPPAAGNGLEQRLMALETDYSSRVQAEAGARLDEAQRQVTEFANAKGADGELLHPFFAEVETDMAMLAQLDRAQGHHPAIDDLYDRAVWARQSTREKLVSSQREAEEKRAAAERKAKSEAARRAGVSVNGAPGPGSAPNSTPERSLRDELKAQLAAVDRR